MNSGAYQEQRTSYDNLIAGGAIMMELERSSVILDSLRTMSTNHSSNQNALRRSVNALPRKIELYFDRDDDRQSRSASAVHSTKQSGLNIC